MKMVAVDFGVPEDSPFFHSPCSFPSVPFTNVKNKNAISTCVE